MKHPEALLCAHCHATGVQPTCPVCRRSVCPSCAEDWTTCREPSSRLVRLGIGRRLRVASPDGHQGIATRIVGSARILDLKRLRWLREISAGGLAGTVPTLLAGDVMARPRYELQNTGNGTTRVFRGIDILGSEASPLLVKVDPPRHMQPSASGNCLVATTHSEMVELVYLPSESRPEGRRIQVDPIPRKVLQAVSYDDRTEELLACSWSEAVIRSVDDDRLGSSLRLEPPTGDVMWAGIRGNRAAVLGGSIYWPELRIFDTRTGSLISDHQYDGRFEDHGAMSGDGRYVALARKDHAIVVIDSEAGRTTVLDDATDDICLVSFVGDQLIVGDCDNRLFLYTLVDGQVAPLIETEIPDDLMDG